jgi:hypothetical protein
MRRRGSWADRFSHQLSTTNPTAKHYRRATPGAEEWTAGESAAEERGYDLSSENDPS